MKRNMALAGLRPALLIALGTSLITAATPKAVGAEVQPGERIYREGKLPSGDPLLGVVQGDVALRGAQVACANCHRRSGFGSFEGDALVPPVTGPALSRERRPRRADLFRGIYQEAQAGTTRVQFRTPRLRPAYTDATLAVALREGRDPTGRALDPLMPRYDLGDEEMGHLVAYLRRLASAPTPGVEDGEIHFAVVTTGGVALKDEEAMTRVIDAFVRRKNLAVEQESARRLPSDDELVRGRRRWVVHPWKLRGAPRTWGDQLEAYHRERPVLALLSGLAAGPWDPIHEFCERAEVPCLFPNTDLPAVTGPNAYTLYFSRGLVGEAEALAHWLAREARGGELRAVQVYRDEPEGRALARGLRLGLGGTPGICLMDGVLKDGAAPAPDVWKDQTGGAGPTVLVLWLRQADLETYLARANNPGDLPRLYLSSSLLADSSFSLPRVLPEGARLTHPYSLPGVEPPGAYRVRAWLNSRGIHADGGRIQLNTYFALSVVDDSLPHIVGDITRDYLIERVEHEAEVALNPGVFPRLSLGPGQRVASRGCYIIAPDRTLLGQYEALSDWIIP